jgi:hypothetical protein
MPLYNNVAELRQFRGATRLTALPTTRHKADVCQDGNASRLSDGLRGDRLLHRLAGPNHNPPASGDRLARFVVDTVVNPVKRSPSIANIEEFGFALPKSYFRL